MVSNKYRISSGANPNFGNFSSIAYNDPAFALGMLLAQAYNKRYDDRGVRKSLEKIENEYGNNGPGLNDDMQALKAVEENYKQNARDTLGTQSQPELYNIAKNMGVDNAVTGAGGALSPLNNPANFQSGSEFDRRSLAAIAERNNQLGALKELGVVPKTVDELGQGTLMKRAAASDMAQAAYNDRMANFNAKDAMSNVVLQMQKDGRSAEQIERVKEIMGDKFQSMQDKSYEEKAKDIIGKLNIMDNTSPAYQQTIGELAKYNPTAAKLYSENIVNLRDKWNASEDDRKYDRNYNYKKKEAEDNVERQKGITRFNVDENLRASNANAENRYNQARSYGFSDEDAKAYALGGKGNSGSQKRDDTTYNIAREIEKDVEKKIQEAAAGNEKYIPTEDEMRNVAYARAYRKGLYGDDESENTEPSVDWGDYNSAGSHISALINGGKYTKEAIRDYVLKQMGDTDFSNKLLSDFGIGRPVKQAAEAKNDDEKIKKEQEEAVALREARKNASFVNPWTGTPWAVNPWTGRK